MIGHGRAVGSDEYVVRLFAPPKTKSRVAKKRDTSKSNKVHPRSKKQHSRSISLLKKIKVSLVSIPGKIPSLLAG